MVQPAISFDSIVLNSTTVNGASPSRINAGSEVFPVISNSVCLSGFLWQVS